MSSVSKNIKRLRLSSGMTQDQLAAELHVTRQAVSNWENGKTQPDLETLRSLADVFETDEMELIYGKKTPLRGLEEYPHNKGIRIRITVLFGSLAIIFLLVRLIWLPQSLVKYSYYRFHMGPVYASLLFVRPFLTVAICLFALSLMSIWKDIRIKSRISKNLFLTMAITCVILYYGLLLLLFWRSQSFLPLPGFLFDLSVAMYFNPEYIFSVIGIAAFLGLNR